MTSDPNSPNKKTIRQYFLSNSASIFTGLNIGLIICGFVCLIVGLFIGNPIFYAFGGALFGANFSAIFSRISNLDLSQKIEANFETFHKSLESRETKKFISDESSIKDFKKTWHLYHVTKFRKKYCWRYSTFDFAPCEIPGCLYTTIKFNDENGESKSYSVEGGVRESRLILICTPMSGKEEPAVLIFPSTNYGFTKPYYGHITLMTYGPSPLISGAILSRNPIFGTNETIIDSALIQQMNEQWRDELTETLKFAVFPVAEI